MGWSYQCLHNGVVGGVHVGIKGEGALSITVVGCVAFRSNDPVLRGTRDSKYQKAAQPEQMKSIESYFSFLSKSNFNRLEQQKGQIWLQPT